MPYRSLVLAGTSYNYIGDPATVITPDDENSAFPKAFLADRRMANPFRFNTDASGRLIKFDLGSSRAVDFLGIFGHNLTSGITQVRLEWSADGATGWTLAASRTHEQPAFYLYLGAGAVTKRYWRVVFVGTNGSAIWIGEMVLGRATVLAKNPNYPVRVVPAEAHIVQGLPNGDEQVIARTLKPSRRLDMSFQGSATDQQDAFDQVYSPCRGKLYSAVFVPQADDAYTGAADQTLQADQHVVMIARLDNDWPAEQAAKNTWTWRVGATEQAYPQPLA